MSEYINKDELIDYIGEYIKNNAGIGLFELLDAIKDFPLAPMCVIIGNRLKDGQWVNSTNKDGKCVCIICGKLSNKRTNFCPYCGARNQ